MEEKDPHAEEVEGTDFPREPTAREASVTAIREEAAALGERVVGGGWWFQNEPQPRPSIIGHKPPGAEILAHQEFCFVPHEFPVPPGGGNSGPPRNFSVFPRPRADSVYPQAPGTLLCRKF